MDVPAEHEVPLERLFDHRKGKLSRAKKSQQEARVEPELGDSRILLGPLAKRLDCMSSHLVGLAKFPLNKLSVRLGERKHVAVERCDALRWILLTTNALKLMKFP